MLRRPWSRRCLSTLIAASALGCSRDPDVVALTPPVTVSNDGGDPYFDLPLVDGCKPGRYAGSVVSVPGDGGVSFPFVGNIQFALVEAPSGEFLMLRSDATLSGSTDTGATFTADLRASGGELDSGSSIGNGCREGQVETSMRDGQYRVTSQDAGSSGCQPNGCFGFDGPVHGTYFGDPQRAFVGTWSARIGGTPFIVQGAWTALWVGKN